MVFRVPRRRDHKGPQWSLPRPSSMRYLCTSIIRLFADPGIGRWRNPCNLAAKGGRWLSLVRPASTKRPSNPNHFGYVPRAVQWRFYPRQSQMRPDCWFGGVERFSCTPLDCYDVHPAPEARLNLRPTDPTSQFTAKGRFGPRVQLARFPSITTAPHIRG